VFDLAALGLSDLVRISAMLRAPGEADSMEGAARAVVRFLHENLLDKATGERSCALVRCYRTQPYASLPDDLKAFADRSLRDDDDRSALRCLTLLATAGEEPDWNDRRRSAGHQAIPLPSPEVVARSPMIHRLIADLGLDVAQLAGGSASLLVDARPRPYNVFHVPVAEGSPYVPAQDDFVVPYGIRSVLGFGGLLPDGDLFAVILFSRTPISRETAEQFRSVTLAVGLAFLPHLSRVFDDTPATAAPPPLAEWRADALAHLLTVREEVILEQSLRLEQAFADLEDRARELSRSRAVLGESEARKAAILDAALDAVVTIDAGGTIVEFNPAAEQLFGRARAEAIGEPMPELLIPPRLRAAHHAGFGRHLATGEARILNTRVEIDALHASGREVPVELTVTRIDVEGPPMFTAHVRDLTSAKRTEAELRELADTLQAGLLPPRTPVVPWLDVATHYRAGGSGVRVGGDFYDVFKVGADEWGVIIGDVCGKGARAASLTALVRYTARAAAAHSAEPAEVVREMNAAVLDDEADDRYCSAVYARLRVAAGGVDVTACGGGHPSPIRVGAAGGAEAVPTGGQLVGLFEDYETGCVEVRLEPGDALVLYTDGVTEARSAAGELYGEERLRAVLAGHGGASAEALVDAVVRDLAEWTDQPGDDVALVALRATG
jgi:PAS domain S-box-containing protein